MVVWRIEGDVEMSTGTDEVIRVGFGMEGCAEGVRCCA